MLTIEMHTNPQTTIFINYVKFEITSFNSILVYENDSLKKSCNISIIDQFLRLKSYAPEQENHQKCKGYHSYQFHNFL